MSLAPFLGALLAIVAWGSFTVPSKAEAVVAADLHPFWFQFYVSIGVTLSSFLLLFIQPDGLSDLTVFGLLSAAMWVSANSAAMFAVKILGIAMAQSTWGALIAVISFVSSLLFRDSPRSLPLAWLGVLILIAGIALLAYVSSKSSSSSAPPSRDDTSPTNRLIDALDSDDDAPDSDVETLSPVAPSSPSLYAPPSPAPPPNKLAGAGCVLVTGIFAGTIFIPLRLAPERYRDDLHGAVKFSLSQGLGTLPVALVWVPFLFYAFYLASGSKAGFRAWLPPHHCHTCAGPGMLSGFLWNLGNLGATLAELPPLQAVGYPITQSALLVGCAWGVFYFKEIKGRENIQLFWFGALVTMIGLVVTGWWGQV